jgi:hypothetical protein
MPVVNVFQGLQPLQELMLILVGALTLAVLIKPRWLRRVLPPLEAMCRRFAYWCEQRTHDIVMRQRGAHEPAHGQTQPGQSLETVGAEEQGSSPNRQHEVETSGVWVGAVLLAQLLWGVFAACLLGAMILLDTGRSCAVQGGGEDCAILLPFGLSFGVINGVLWAVTLAYFGGIFIEGIGWVVGKHLHLFPDLSPRPRRLLTIYAGVGVSLSLVAVSLMYVISAMQLQHVDWPEAALALAVLQALLINGAAFAAVPSLIGGIGALLALLCVTGGLLAMSLAHLVRLLGYLLEPHQPGANATSASNFTSTDLAFQGGESSMYGESKERKKIFYVVGIGRESASSVQQQVEFIHIYGGDAVFGGYAVVNPARPDEAPLTPANDDDLRPLRSEIALAPQLRQDLREQEQLVVQKAVRKVEDKKASRRQLRGELFVCCDREYVPLLAETLRGLAPERTGMLVNLAVLESRSGVLRPEEIAASDVELARLLDERIIASALIIDPFPTEAAHDKEELGARRRMRQFAAALAQVVAGFAQHPEQLTQGEALQRVGYSCGYCAMATLTDSVPLGKRMRFLEPFSWMLKRRSVGYGDAAVMSARVLQLAARARRDPALRSANVPPNEINEISPGSVLCVTSPLEPSDRRYPEFVSTVEHGMAGLAEGVTTIFACGNGLPDRKLPEGLYVQVTYFFGFDEAPAHAKAQRSTLDAQPDTAQVDRAGGGADVEPWPLMPEFPQLLPAADGTNGAAGTTAATSHNGTGPRARRRGAMRQHGLNTDANTDATGRVDGD